MKTEQYRKTVAEIRKNLIDGIVTFIKELGISELKLSDISCCTPTLMEDPYEEDCTVTLNWIETEGEKVFFSGSSCCTSLYLDSGKQQIDVDVLLDIYDWLQEHREDIKEYEKENCKESQKG